MSVMTRNYRPVRRRTHSSCDRHRQIWHHRPVASLCVFCGSSSGTDPVYTEAAHLLGTAIATAGHGLVYGGGHVGLMGVVADAALAAGGRVTGVMTEQLVAAEVAHDGLTRLEVVGSMHERKARMADLSDGVIVLPGGFGTLDEAFEIATWNQLGLVAAPVVFLDVAGYFTALFEFVDHGVAAGFVGAHHRELLQRTAAIGEAIELAMAPAAPFAPKWLG
jgi:uncharacterized protein (TIGR00730 family)